MTGWQSPTFDRRPYSAAFYFLFCAKCSFCSVSQSSCEECCLSRPSGSFAVVLVDLVVLLWGSQRVFSPRAHPTLHEGNDDARYECKHERRMGRCNYSAVTKKRCLFRHSVMPTEGFSISDPGACHRCGGRHYTASCPSSRCRERTVSVSRAAPERTRGRELPVSRAERAVRVERTDLPWYVLNEGAPECKHERKHGQCNRECNVGKQCFFAHSVMPKKPHDSDLLGAPSNCQSCGEYGHSMMACPVGKKKSPGGRHRHISS